MAERTSVFVVPPPTANGPLHLGHLSGPYLAADIAARAAREGGGKVLALGGVDVHQNYVLTRAQNEGVDVEKLVAEYRRRIDDAYELARINCDAHVDPEDRGHQAVIASMVRDLVDDGTFGLREMTLHACDGCGRTLHHSYVVGTCSRCGSGASGGSCESCGGFTSAQDLLDPSCDRCGGAPRELRATVPVLSLEDYRPRLTEIWLRAEMGPRVRELVAGYLADRLPDIPVAYPTNWGTRAVDGQRVDVYVDVALSTFLTVARHLDPSVNDLAGVRRAWREVSELWHFNGIDNAFYFAVLWPAVYLAAGATPDQLAGTVVNEFFTLDGAKFSTSRDHAIWVDEMLATEDPETVRLFLAWARPDMLSTDFTRASYDDFRRLVTPVLDGVRGPGGLSAGLATAEVTRGEAALRPESFDAALAVRCLLNVLASGGHGVDSGPLHRALAGIDRGSR